MASLDAFEFEVLFDNFKDNAVIRCALLREEAPKAMADAFVKEAKDFFIEPRGHALDGDEYVPKPVEEKNIPWDSPVFSDYSSSEDEMISADEGTGTTESTTDSYKTAKTSLSSESGFSEGEESVSSGSSTVPAAPMMAMNNFPVYPNYNMQIPPLMNFCVPPPPPVHFQPPPMALLAPPLPMIPTVDDLMQMALYADHPEFQLAFNEALPFYQMVYSQRRF